MPYAFAHPAAVVPLHRLLGHRGALSALVIGSIVPDLWHFAPSLVDRRFAHSPAGLLAFALPVGMLAYLLFHHLLKRPLLDLLPGRLRVRLSMLDPVRAPNAFLVAACILLGACTHIVSDAFTHESSLASRYLPVLDAELAQFGGYTLHVPTALQHASTVAGTGLLLWWISRWWRQEEEEAKGKLEPGIPAGARALAWILLAMAPLLAAMAGALDADWVALDLPAWRTFAREIAFDALGALLLASALYALAWHAASARLASTPNPNSVLEPMKRVAHKKIRT